MSQKIEAPPLKSFLSLTPPVSKELQSPPTSRLSSIKEVTLSPVLANRDHRGSAASDSSVSSDYGENGFLILTSVEKQSLVNLNGLNKIEEEVIEE